MKQFFTNLYRDLKVLYSLAIKRGRGSTAEERLESFYSGQAEEANEMAALYARQYRLLVTYGSDNHWGSRAFATLREKGFKPELAGMASERPIRCVSDFIEMVKNAQMTPFFVREGD